MKYLIAFTLIIHATVSFNQKILKDIHLFHSLKQDGEQFQFKVLDKDKKGVRFYRKDRFYYWYKAQHVLTTQGGSSGQILHGEFEAFYDSKQLSKKGTFTKGLKDDEWLYWRKDGTLIKSENWKRGKLSGIETHYNSRGEAFQTIKHSMFSTKRENADSIIIHKTGKTTERISLKDSLDKVYRVENKKNGLLHGTVTEIENGKTVAKTKFKNGEQVVIKKDTEQSEQGNDSSGEKKKWWNFFKKKEGKTENDEKAGKAEKSDRVKEPRSKKEPTDKEKKTEKVPKEKTVKERKNKEK